MIMAHRSGTDGTSKRPKTWRRTSRWAASLGVAATLTAGCADEFTPSEREALLNASSGEPCDAPRDLFPQSCSGSLCHSPGGPAPTDLTSPEVASRVLDVPAQDCSGRVLVSSAPGGDAYLLEKVSTDTPQCGDRMPGVLDGRVLTDAEIACLQAWIDGLRGL
jgi:hypothetical protein